MKTSLLFFLTTTAFAQSQSQSQSQAEALADKKIVFLGDSITQNGAYVSFISHYLERSFLSKKFNIFSLGLSSETLSGLTEDGHAGGRFPRPCLFERLPRLLEKLQPDVIFACYGINDGIYQPFDQKRFEAFQSGVLELIKQAKNAGVTEIFIVTPPIFDFTPKQGEFNYDTVLTTYAEWEMTINEPGVTIIDLHTAMRNAREASPTPFSPDHIHPNEDGQLVIARSILSALGLTIPEDTLNTIHNDPLFQAINALRSLRSETWMKHIGYTRETTVPPQSLGTTEIDTEKIRLTIDRWKAAH